LLNLPIGFDTGTVEKRAQRIAKSAKENGDCLVLRQLWCVLRSAEMSRPAGNEREQLHRMREDVAKDLAKTEHALAG
jgi:hypothetical protein